VPEKLVSSFILSRVCNSYKSVSQYPTATKNLYPVIKPDIGSSKNNFLLILLNPFLGGNLLGFYYWQQ